MLGTCERSWVGEGDRVTNRGTILALDCLASIVESVLSDLPIAGMITDCCWKKEGNERGMVVAWFCSMREVVTVVWFVHLRQGKIMATHDRSL